MKKRILGIVLCLVMVLSLLPSTSIAAQAADLYPTHVTVGDIDLTDGKCIKNGQPYDGQQPGWTAYYKDGVLTLNNHQDTVAKQSCIRADNAQELTINLIGNNSLTTTSTGSEMFGICAWDVDRLTITSTSNGTLNVSAINNDTHTYSTTHGIAMKTAGGVSSGEVVINGNAVLTLGVEVFGSGNNYAYGISANGHVSVQGSASLDMNLIAHATNPCYITAFNSSNVAINTTRSITVNMSSTGNRCVGSVTTTTAPALTRADDGVQVNWTSNMMSPHPKNSDMQFDPVKFVFESETGRAAWMPRTGFTVTYARTSSCRTGETAQQDTKIPGEPLTLRGETFHAASGHYAQDGWSIYSNGQEKTYPLYGIYNVDADITLYPYFAQQRAVTVTADGHGTASASADWAIDGQTVTLTATPNSGYHFKEWQVTSGGVTVTDNQFTMGTAPVTVKAVFEARTYHFTTQPVGGTARAGQPYTVSWECDGMPTKVELQRWKDAMPAGWVDWNSNFKYAGDAGTVNDSYGTSGTQTFRLKATFGAGVEAYSDSFTVTYLADPTFMASGSDCGTLQNVAPGYEYSVDGGMTYYAVTGSTMDITNVTAAKDILVKIPGESTPFVIDITQKSAPVQVAAQHGTTSSGENYYGHLINTEYGMEYRAESESCWTSIGGSSVTCYNNDTYYVRYWGWETELASEAVAVYVHKYIPTYTVRVTPAGYDFGTEAPGYSSLAPVTFTLTNTGDAELRGVSVTLGDGGEALTLNNRDTRMYLAPGDTTTFTLTPSAGLAEGTYSATVNVTSDQGATDSIVVTFTVKTPIGDVNGDGAVDDLDLTALLRHVAKIRLLENDSHADVNKDGMVDAADVTALAILLEKN